MRLKLSVEIKKAIIFLKLKTYIRLIKLMSISVIRVLAVFLTQANQIQKSETYQFEFRIFYCQTTHYC